MRSKLLEREIFTTLLKTNLKINLQENKLQLQLHIFVQNYGDSSPIINVPAYDHAEGKHIYSGQEAHARDMAGCKH